EGDLQSQVLAFLLGLEVGLRQIRQPVQQVIGGAQGQQPVLPVQVQRVFGLVVVEFSQRGLDELTGGGEQLREVSVGHLGGGRRLTHRCHQIVEHVVL